MKNDLYKHILQFYSAIGVDVFFCNTSFGKISKNNNKVSIDSHKIYNNQYVNNYSKNSDFDTELNTNNNHYNSSNTNINNNLQIESNPQLKQLLQEINNIDCLIKHTARNTVVFDGDINSKIMIIGEAPGQEEDIQGKPFVGQSGMLLNNMLHAIGLSRQDVIIANIVFWRPPLNRTPSSDEISLCLPYVKRLIQIINPEVLLLLGGVSNHALLNTMASMSMLRGSINNVLNIRTVSTYHPAYLLRSSTQKQHAFRDFLLLRKLIDKMI